MPQHELERLSRVNRFLKIQLDKQQEFEEIAQLAADICGVPNALITLVGEDDEFSLTDDQFLHSSDRADSFCSYVVDSGTLMVVPDAALNPFLKNYPAVTRKAGIRFYAGAPLTTRDGYTLGSLCVIDQKPGELSHIQKEMLQNLASQVIQLLEFESNLHFLKEQYLSTKKMELKMSSFFESTASSHLLIDRDLQVVCFNKAVEEFIEKVYQVTIKPGMNIRQFVSAAYMQDFIENCEKALSGQSITLERLLSFAGHKVWCLISYDPARNSEGEIIGISYNSSDISKRMVSQQLAAEQQMKLEHIAYMQSHEFRRPVATIKGLLTLIEMDGHDVSYPMIKVIKECITNIDDKIVEIVNITSPREEL